MNDATAGPPCSACPTRTPLHTDTPRPGMSECDCGALYLAGVLVLSCTGCSRTLPVTELTDDRCEDCEEQHQRVLARERNEQQRESVYEMAYEAKRDGWVRS